MGKDGITKLATLEAVERLNGVPPDELIELQSHELPVGCEYLWEWFLRLNMTRPSGFGAGPITETELRSFFFNRKIQPTPWELEALIQMDTAKLSAIKKPPPEEEE